MDRKNVGVTSSLFSSVLDDSWQAVESLLTVTADDPGHAVSSGAGRDGSKRGKRRSVPPTFPVAVHERDDAGSTALHLAAARSSTRCIRTLIGAGASLGALDLESAWTPLHKALWTGHLGAALLLVAAGAALDDVSEAGLTRRGRPVRQGWLQKPLTPLAPSCDPAVATPLVGGRDGCSPLNLATSALRPRQGVALSQIERERQWLLRTAASSPASSRAMWPCVIGPRISLQDACSRGCRGSRVRPGGPRPLCTSCLAASTARDGSSGSDRDCGYSSAVSLHSWGKANGFGLGYATAASRDVVLQLRLVDLPAAAQQQPLGLGSVRGNNVDDTTVCAVAAGRHHTLILTTGGSVLAFGLGQGGKLGLVLPAASGEPTAPLAAHVASVDTATDSPAPLPVRPSPGDTVAVGAKAIPTAQVLPTRIPAFLLSGIRVVQISVSAVHSLAVSADGELFAWGDNTTGCLGFGHSGSSAGPVLLPDSAMSCAGASCASSPLSAQGSIYPTPRRVEGALRKVHIVCAAAAVSHSLAVGVDGSLWSWGRNCQGQLGRKVVAAPGPPLTGEAAAVASTSWTPARADSLPALQTSASGEGVRGRRRIVASTVRDRSVSDVELALALEASRATVAAAAGRHVGGPSASLGSPLLHAAAALAPPYPDPCTAPHPGSRPRAPGHLLPLYGDGGDGPGSSDSHSPLIVAAAGAYSLVLTRGGGVFACGNGRPDWQRLHFDAAAAQHRDAVAAYLEAESELRAAAPATPRSARGPHVAVPGTRPPTTPAAAAAELAAAGFAVLHYGDSATATQRTPTAAASGLVDAAGDAVGAGETWALQKRGKRAAPQARLESAGGASASVAPPRFGSSFGQSAVILQISAAPSHAVAVDTEGCVWTWGAAEELLGHALPLSTAAAAAAASAASLWTLPPRRVSAFARAGVCVVSVAAAAHCTTAVDALGSLWTWGDGVAAEAGLLGHGLGGRAALPRHVSSVTGAILAVPGVHHMMLVTSLLLPPLPPLLPSIADASAVARSCGITGPLSLCAAMPHVGPVSTSGDNCCATRCGIYGGIVDDLARTAAAGAEDLLLVQDDYTVCTIPSLSSLCQRALARTITSIPAAHAALALAESMAAPGLAAYTTAILHSNADAVLTAFACAAGVGVGGSLPRAAVTGWDDALTPQAASALNGLSVDSLAAFSWKNPAALSRARTLAAEDHARMVAIYKASKRAEYDMVRPCSQWRGQRAAAAGRAGVDEDTLRAPQDSQLRLASHYSIPEPVFVATAEGAAITRSLLFPDAPVAGEAMPSLVASPNDGEQALTPVALVEGDRFRQVLTAASAAWQAMRTICGPPEEREPPWSPLATPKQPAPRTGQGRMTPSQRTPLQSPESNPIGLGLGDFVLSEPLSTPASQHQLTPVIARRRARTPSSAGVASEDDDAAGDDDNEDDEHSRRSLRRRLVWEGAGGGVGGTFPRDAGSGAVMGGPAAVPVAGSLMRWIEGAAAAGLSDAVAASALQVLSLASLVDEALCSELVSASHSALVAGSAPASRVAPLPAAGAAMAWAVLAASSCGAVAACMRRTKALRKKLLGLTSVAYDAARSIVAAVGSSSLGGTNTTLALVAAVSERQSERLARRGALVSELWCLVPVVTVWLRLAERHGAAALADAPGRAAVGAARMACGGFAELARIGLIPGAFPPPLQRGASGGAAAPSEPPPEDVIAAGRAAVAALRTGAPFSAAVRAAVAACIPGAAGVLRQGDPSGPQDVEPLLPVASALTKGCPAGGAGVAPAAPPSGPWMQRKNVAADGVGGGAAAQVVTTKGTAVARSSAPPSILQSLSGSRDWPSLQAPSSCDVAPPLPSLPAAAASAAPLSALRPPKGSRALPAASDLSPALAPASPQPPGASRLLARSPPASPAVAPFAQRPPAKSPTASPPALAASSPASPPLLPANPRGSPPPNLSGGTAMRSGVGGLALPPSAVQATVSRGKPPPVGTAAATSPAAAAASPSASAAAAPPPQRTLRSILEDEEKAAAARAGREAQANEARLATAAAAAAERSRARAPGPPPAPWVAAGAAAAGASSASAAAAAASASLAAIQAEQAAAAQRHEASLRQIDLRYAAAIAGGAAAAAMPGGAALHVPRRVRPDPGAGGSPWGPVPGSPWGPAPSSATSASATTPTPTALPDRAGRGSAETVAATAAAARGSGAPLPWGWSTPTSEEAVVLPRAEGSPPEVAPRGKRPQQQRPGSRAAQPRAVPAS